MAKLRLGISLARLGRRAREPIEGTRGEIVYDPEAKTIEITGLPKEVTEKMKELFSQPDHYELPLSDRLDDYILVKGMPTDTPARFMMSLTNIAARLNLYVHWSKKAITSVIPE